MVRFLNRFAACASLVLPARPSTQRVILCFVSTSRLCQLVVAHLRTLLVLGVSAEHLCGFAARYHYLSANMVHSFLPSEVPDFFSRFFHLFTQAPGHSAFPFSHSKHQRIGTYQHLYFTLREQVLCRVQLYMSVPGVCAESIATAKGAWCVRRGQHHHACCS